MGFEPTPPERLGLKSNAFLALLLLKKDQLGHGYNRLNQLRRETALPRPLQFALEFALGCNRIAGEAIQPQETCRRTLSKRGRGRGTSRTVASAVGAGLATSALGIAAGAMSALALAAIAARA